ncbi:protein of unknown function [Nitrospira defluvii]|uniref:Uncharacterized protein n=1 Tax=Nitrospira defluvii TaxID=330214 RepID=D8P840_9BACT|nr:protein of unknown function [Nitrospira defluvii]
MATHAEWLQIAIVIRSANCLGYNVVDQRSRSSAFPAPWIGDQICCALLSPLTVISTLG